MVDLKGRSRPLSILCSRLATVSTHMELVDAAFASIDLAAARSTRPESPLITAIGLPPNSHKRLKLRAREHRSVTNHGRARNAEHTIQLLYTHFTTYLRSVLREMYEHRPLQIVEKAHGQFRFHEIVQLGSYDAICQAMVDQVFRTLEAQRSTSALLDKILDKTEVSVDDDLRLDAMMYLEMRHLLVHNAGIVDDKFMQAYGENAPDSHLGRHLNSSIGIARRAIDSIERLCTAVDAGLVEAGYLVPPRRVGAGHPAPSA
jgi:hypothetical protein